MQRDRPIIAVIERKPYDPNYEPQWRNGAKYGYPECCILSFIELVMIRNERPNATGDDGRILCPECSITGGYDDQ